MANWTPENMDAIPLQVVMGAVPHYINVGRDGKTVSVDSG